MAFDMNIPVEAGTDVARIRQLASECRRLGYTGCALNTITSVPIRPKDLCKLPRIELVSESSSMNVKDITTSLQADSTTDRRGRGKKRKRQVGGNSSSVGVDSGSERELTSNPTPAPWRTLTRITITVDSMASPGAADLLCGGAPQMIASQLGPGAGAGAGQGATAVAAVLSSYDLVAIAPGDSNTLRAVCASGCADIIALDMAGGKPPFPLSLADVQAVRQAGMAFELEYAPAIRDPTARRFLMSNVSNLLRLLAGSASSGAAAKAAVSSRHGSPGAGPALTGRRAARALLCALVIGSAARHPLELRSPADASSILSLAGTTLEQCRRALFSGAGLAVRHAERRLGGTSTGGLGALFLHVDNGGSGKSSGAARPFLSTQHARA